MTTHPRSRLPIRSTCDSSAAVCGQHTYLDRILYTDATSVITDFNGPPYEIDFIRESGIEGELDRGFPWEPETWQKWLFAPNELLSPPIFAEPLLF